MTFPPCSSLGYSVKMMASPAAAGTRVMRGSTGSLTDCHAAGTGYPDL